MNKHKFVPLLSYVMPERLLRFLDRHVPVGFDPADGWSFWLDISYHRWCRQDQKRSGTFQ